MKKFRAGAYVRLSKEDKEKLEESISITNQKKIIKEFVLKEEIEIIDYYVDDGFSGANFNRPGFKRLLNDIECGIINCVIVKDMSRLGRNFIDTGNYVYRYFPEKDVRFIAILDKFDTYNPKENDDIIPIIAAFNDLMLRNTSRKIKNVRHNQMKEGLYVGSTVPYGYKRSEENNKKFVIDEYAAKNVRNIFELKASGMSIAAIARKLTEEGILPPDVYRGRKIKQTLTTNVWKSASVKTIIQNEVYLGTLIQGKYERKGENKSRNSILPKDQWIIKKNAHPAIIDKELFNKVNLITSNDKADEIRNRKYDYLLKGLVKCEECGKTMIVRRIKNSRKELKHCIYLCRTYATYRNHNLCTMHYFREDLLNEIVISKLRNIFTKQVDINNITSVYKDVVYSSSILDQYNKDLKNHNLKLANIDKALSELYKDKVNNVITQDEFVNIKNDFTIEKKQLEKEIVNLKLQINNLNKSLEDTEKRDKIIDDFLKMKKPNKQILRKLINKITIDENKKVKIYFNFNTEKVNCNE